MLAKIMFMKLTFLLVLISAQILVWGQTCEVDRLRRLLDSTSSDTARMLLKVQIAHAYFFFKSDSGIALCEKAPTETQKIHFPKKAKSGP